MNPFKKFCLSFFIILFLLCAVVHPVLFYSNLGFPGSVGKLINNWFRIKESYAKKIADHQKIVFFACSATFYAIDSERIEHEIGIPVVNFGTTVSLRKYMFDRVKASLRSGDIVIMPLEYHIYRDVPLFDRDDNGHLTYIYEYDPEYFNSRPFLEKLEFIYHANVPFLFRKVINRFVAYDKDKGDDPSNFLGSYWVNEHGDLTSNTYETSFYRDPQSPTENTLRKGDVVGKGMGTVFENFVKYCRENNIRVYVTWQPLCPSTKSKAFSTSDLEKVNAIREFWKKLDVEILGNCEDVFYEADQFYNSPNHLNNRGREKYTAHMIELLRGII